MEGDEGRDGSRTAGFHLDAFLSPFESLRTIVRQWKRADAHRKQTGSMAETISFQTGRLALPYQARGCARRDPEALRTSCREDYDPSTVPAAAGVLIGACDVQDNRLEAEISAWGLVEVARDDASQLRAGAVTNSGASNTPGAGIACAVGRWIIAASMATRHAGAVGAIGGVHGAPAAARDRPDVAPRPRSESTPAATTARKLPISARCGAGDINP